MSSEGSDRKKSSGAASSTGHSSRKDRSAGRIVKAGSKRASSAGHSSGHDKAASSARSKKK